MSHDDRLQHAILAEFNWEPSIDATHIGVAVTDGIATLTGHAESFAAKHALEAAARRVKGVLAVVEEIDVRLPVATKRNDEDIAAAAVERLAWNVSVPPDSVQVTVEKGWVTLTGAVDWNFQKAAAAAEISYMFGVVGVSNQITIKPKVSAATISDDITHALHRSWFFDPKMIKVSADGGKIRLTGVVHSPHDRQVAAATAWAAPGVTEVDNGIVIA